MTTTNLCSVITYYYFQCTYIYIYHQQGLRCLLRRFLREGGWTRSTLPINTPLTEQAMKTYETRIPSTRSYHLFFFFFFNLTTVRPAGWHKLHTLRIYKPGATAIVYPARCYYIIHILYYYYYHYYDSSTMILL